MQTDRLDEAGCNRLLGLLDREERERANRFRFESDRRDFIAAHALLRRMLTFFFGSRATAWRFSADPLGKPKIAAELRPSEVDFNLSHTRDLVAAAVTTHGAVGVDVEKINPAKADFDIAQRYFAPSEVELLRQAPAPERVDVFFKLWTLKEAYLKATGSGLATPLDSFAFTLAPIRISFLEKSAVMPQCWHFETLATTGRHALSVAVTAPDDHAVRVVPQGIVPDDL